MRNPKSKIPNLKSKIIPNLCNLWIIFAACFARGGTVEADTVLADEVRTREISYPQPSTNDVVLYYSFAANGGYIVPDSSGNGYSGVPVGCTWVNYAGRFSGGAMSWGTNTWDAAVIVGSRPDFLSWEAYTLSVWFKYVPENSAYRAAYMLIAKASGDLMETGLFVWPSPDGFLAFVLNSDTAGFVNLFCFRKNVLDGIWHHAVVVRAGNVGQLWLDGELEDSTAGMFTVKSTASSLCLGNCYYGPYERYNWSGLMDEVRIYDRALSPTEIAYLYAIGSFPPPQPPQPSGEEVITVTSDLSVAGELTVSGDVLFLSGVQLAQPLGDLSSGSYTNAPPMP